MRATQTFLELIGKTVKLNISLTLPGMVKRRVIEESGRIARTYETYFTLGNWENVPHVTLCSIEFPVQKTREVYDIVSRIADRHMIIECVPTGVVAHQGYVGIQLEKTKEILRLHTELLKNLAPLRFRSEDKGAHFRMNLSDAQLQHIVDYGYPDAFELFSPHFTITRLRNDVDIDTVVKNIDWVPAQFKVSCIGVYLVGEHGTCTMGIMEFPLAG